MKFNRENDNSLSVSISKNELHALGIRLEDLKYGNAATASFIREILFRARIELDFEPLDHGIRTEIIPKADGGVELIYTFAEEFEETDPRYATFSPFIQEQAFKDYDSEDDDLVSFQEEEEEEFDEIPEPEDSTDLNEVRKAELFDEAEPEPTQMEEFLRQLKENGEATASFSIFADGADISKDANASQSFDRFMNYLVKGSAGHEFFVPFKNLIAKLRESSGTIPATAQEDKKAAPAEPNKGRASHGTRTKTGKTAQTAEPPLTQDMLFVFRFDSFNDACRAAVCAGPYSGENALYKSPSPENAYYLLMHTVGATAHAVNSTCSIFQEFGKIVSRDNLFFESHAKEHFECLIASDAILHLCEIGG